ncbi:MAG: TrkH family potassium uptake protein [Candidatus Bipolaricaulia bacterium]
MRIAVDLRSAFHLISIVLQGVGSAFLLPAGVALYYGEPVLPWMGVLALTVGLGTALRSVTHGSRHLTMREGFFVVGVSWLAIALFGSVPYLLIGPLGVVDALFESMSGFTTTGATVLTDIEGQSRSLLLWRSLTQWLGGMGIVVLAIAVLPRLGIGGRQLMEAEAPGPEVERLFPHIRQTAQALWGVYLGLTVAEIVALSVAGLSLYEAVSHAFTTVSTGGFSPEARSIEAYSGGVQWIVIVFILLGGSNFALLYRSLLSPLRLPRLLWDNREWRFYAAAYIVFVGLITLNITGLYATVEETIRHGAFQVASIMTTTGYASTDFNAWSSTAMLLLLALMFIGGNAGSTSGSVKVVRTLLILKMMFREIRRILHPKAVIPLRLGDRVISETALRGILVFAIIYVTLFAIGCILLMLDVERAGLAGGQTLTVLDAVSAVAASIGNVGPGFGVFGPMNSYAPLPDTSKLLLAALMWIGRLEIFPIIVLLTKSYWRGT